MQSINGRCKIANRAFRLRLDMGVMLIASNSPAESLLSSLLADAQPLLTAVSVRRLAVDSIETSIDCVLGTRELRRFQNI